MKLLEIRDADIGLKPKGGAKYIPRNSARAVISNKGKVAFLYSGRDKYHMLPGGGVEPGETTLEALEREIFEEVGCSIRVVQEIGEIVEHLTHAGVNQTSHCFLAEVVKEGTPIFTPDEIEEGMELLWVPIDKAIELIKSEKPAAYHAKFIVKRDLMFLETARALLAKKSKSL